MTYPVSTGLRAALDGSHKPVSRLVALYPDRTERQVWDSSSGLLLPGSAIRDRRREVRGTFSGGLADLTGSLAPRVPGDLFATGSLIRVERGALLGATAAYVPLFTGVVTSARPTMSGQMAIAAEDRLSLAQQSFGEVVTLDPALRGWEAVYAILYPVLGGDALQWMLDDGGRTLGIVRAYAEDDDRLASAMTIARDLACELYSDRMGATIMRPVPDPTSLPTARTYQRVPGVAMLLDLERELSGTPYNRSVAVSERTDGPTFRGVAEVTDPASPLHRDRLGYVRTTFLRSAQIATPDQAAAVARTQLWDRGLYEVSIGAVVIPDPTIDEGDVSLFVEPIAGANDRQLLDSVTYPLLQGTMSLSSRRVRALFA